MNAGQNPFRTECLERIPYLEDGRELPVAGLLARLRSLGTRACIIGPEGSGKTTLLEGLWRHCQAMGFGASLVRVPSAAGWGAAVRLFRELRRIPRAHLLLLDSADVLPRGAWWGVRLFSRRFAGVLASSHARPLLPVLWRCRTSPALLCQLHERLAPRAAPLRTDCAAALYHTYAGNLRLCLLACYDAWADAAARGGA